MDKHIARCHCGAVQLDCLGEPLFVAMCHCQECQRRTGSSYNLGAWFGRENVTIKGDFKIHHRAGDEGTALKYYFCSECGSNVYWEASSMQTAVGVAVGCFADADFAQPTVSFYDKRRHSWVKVPENIPRYVAGASSEQINPKE